MKAALRIDAKPVAFMDNFAPGNDKQTSNVITIDIVIDRNAVACEFVLKIKRTKMSLKAVGLGCGE